MASSTHPSFPSRGYASNLGKLPDRSMAPTFGASTTQQQRENARLERERERLEKERLEREEQNQLTEEQREEIKEAVSPAPPACAVRSRGFENGNRHTAEERDRERERGGLLSGQKLGEAVLTALAIPQFNLFDLDKDNKIDYHELKVAMKALGFDLPKPEILSILQTHGAPSPPPPTTTATANQQYAHSNSRLLLPFPQFQTVMAQRILARDPREEILRAFELFDEGGKGKINLGDLRRVARELGEGLEEEELAAMIEEFDLDGDGAIDREEFLGICLQ